MTANDPLIHYDESEANRGCEIAALKPPDFLSWCFHVTAFCKTREEIDLLLAMLTTAKGFLPDVAIKTSVTTQTNPAPSPPKSAGDASA